jgi:hypothetical protein
MPVLPEQVDVNIPLYSTDPPDIKAVEADLQGVTVTFTKPMVIESVDADMFAIAVGAGAGAVATSITPVDSEAAADGSGDRLATKFRLPYPASVKLAEGENTVKVTLTDDAAASWSYATARSWWKASPAAAPASP